MKCRGKHYTTWNIPPSTTFSPLHFLRFPLGECSSLFFGLILAPFPALSIYRRPQSRTHGKPRNRKRKKGRENEVEKRELNELPYSEMVKSETITTVDSPLAGYTIGWVIFEGFQFIIRKQRLFCWIRIILWSGETTNFPSI